MLKQARFIHPEYCTVFSLCVLTFFENGTQEKESAPYKFLSHPFVSSVIKAGPTNVWQNGCGCRLIADTNRFFQKRCTQTSALIQVMLLIGNCSVPLVSHSEERHVRITGGQIGLLL